MNKNLSFEQRIHNVLAGQKVEELKARHAYLHGLDCGREEYGTFWLRSDNSTFGHTFGRMMGFRELVPAHFDDPIEPRSMDLAPEDRLERPGGMGELPDGGPFATAKGREKRTDRPTKLTDMFGELGLYGHNQKGTFCSGAHVLASPVIEVANDGESARSFYLTPGTMMGVVGFGGGRNGMWLWERYGSDFVYKNGRWWWFHEQVCPDIADQYDDRNWAHDLYEKYINGTLAVGNCSGPPVSCASDIRQAHNDISIIQTVQDTVPCPEPYDTLDEEHTYSPGCAEYKDIYIYPPQQGFGDYAW